MPSRRQAFTIFELLFLLAFFSQVLAGAFVLLRTPRHRDVDSQIRDSTQVRGIHQGLVLFAQNNNDSYPVPSVLDKANTTLTAESAKDDLGGVLSILLWNGFFSPELTVSPRERSRLVRVNDTYNLSDPKDAVRTKQGNQALWDPAYRGSSAEQVAKAGTKPVGTLPADANVVAHNSYAFMPFFGERRKLWSNTFVSTEAALGNRGPMYEVLGEQDKVSYRLLDTDAQPKSQGFTSETGKGTTSATLRTYRKDGWSGNIAFNDNHVQFLTRPDPEDVPYTFSGLPGASRQRPDNIFLSENDATVTPMPTQIGTVTLADKAKTNPLTMSNNWLKTWTVQAVEKGSTSAVTFVVD